MSTTRTKRKIKPSARAAQADVDPGSDIEVSSPKQKAATKSKGTGPRRTASISTPSASQTSVVTRSQTKKIDTDKEDDPGGKDDTSEDDEAEEEDEGEEESEGDNVPKKRKKAAKRDESPELEITYNISLFYPSEMEKPAKKRESYASGIMKLPDSVSSRIFDKKLLSKVAKIARLVYIDEDDICVYFHIHP
ncbi:hypothetical protein C8R47DRAFT_1227531 [Mycena vitilis]|nr:hypothetical protein C8R47DRAFT_1227531 [Mycena vitilis]